MKLFEGRCFGFQLFLMVPLLAIGWLVVSHILPANAGQSAHYVDEKTFFSKVRALMHRRGLKDIQFQTYKQIIKYWNDHPDINDRRWLAYVMATAYHETQLRPVREGFKKSDAAARKHVRWMWNKRIITLPYHRPDPVTGQVYYGRGYVQLTWAQNYKKMGEAIGMGDKLYRNPDLVLDPEIASKVLFVGMLKGKFRYSKRTRPKGWQKLRLFFNKKTENWYRARNIINGDLRKNGNRIAGYGRKYGSAIRVVDAPDKPPVTDEGEEPDATPGEGEVVPTLPGGSGDGSSPTQPEQPAQPTQPEQPEPPASPSTGDMPSGETPGGTDGPTEGPSDETPHDGATTDGAAPSSEPATSPDDTAGEVVPSLPEEGEIVPDTPDEPPSEPPVTPPVTPAEPTTDVPQDDGTEVVPIPVEHPELNDASEGGNTGGTDIGTDSPQTPTTPDVSEPSTPSGGEGTDVQTPDEQSDGGASDSSSQSDNETASKGWWGSVKSFFAKYRGYVWKF